MWTEKDAPQKTTKEPRPLVDEKGTGGRGGTRRESRDSEDSVRWEPEEGGTWGV